MALSVVDLYQKVLPRTNCGDCGYPTCLAFASMVVSEKKPLNQCPHLAEAVIARCQPELDAQHAAGKWTKKDMAMEALQWSRERAASIRLQDLPDRIGGRLVDRDGGTLLELPYFTDTVLIGEGLVRKNDGGELNRWEQVFLFNHIAQGGSVLPGRNWKGLEQFPNTVSKIKSMREHVEAPLVERFKGRLEDLRKAARKLGGMPTTEGGESADAVFLFRPLPRVPLVLLFWDQDTAEGFEAKTKLLFDETVTAHLDIESMMFVSERLRQRLIESADHPD
ncbi:MAG: DUF3786 domain-containing protein [Thermodesulfobacteriota bacterium]